MPNSRSGIGLKDLVQESTEGLGLVCVVEGEKREEKLEVHGYGMQFLWLRTDKIGNDRV